MAMRDDYEDYEQLLKDDFLNFRKAKVFFEKGISVHASLKNGDFYNGLITEEPTVDFFFMDDRKEGRKLIFYVELKYPLTEFEPKGKGGGKKHG